MVAFDGGVCKLKYFVKRKTNDSNYLFFLVHGVSISLDWWILVVNRFDLFIESQGNHRTDRICAVIQKWESKQDPS